MRANCVGLPLKLAIDVPQGNVSNVEIFCRPKRDPGIVGFSQRLVAITDWSLTFWGVILTIVGGYSAAAIGQMDLLSDRWLVLGQRLFLLSGVMWVGILVPLQIWMGRMARQFKNSGSIPDGYRVASRAWLAVGIAATVPLIVAMWVMVAKPY